MTALLSLLLVVQPPTAGKVKALYNSLEAESLAQHLAFYELYPQTPEGQKALQHVWGLLAQTSSSQNTELQQFNNLQQNLKGIIQLVTKPASSDKVLLSEGELGCVENLARHLANRKLKGHFANTESEVLALEPSEIDVARGLLLSQLPDNEGKLREMRSYEALLDLMALQIMTKLKPSSSPEDKIDAINRFIFEEMGFRFPPHSLYAKDIDLYTFLPSVLDSRRGVCLGVSILYISLAQRLNLPLEMITPPGHIYVRYRAGDKVINIETTARGIHMDSKHYLSVDTRSLEQRTLKEVIGLAHYNHASVYWQNQEFEKALEAYNKALPYLPDDMLLKEFMAYNYLFTNQREKAEPLLQLVKDHVPDYAVSKQNIAEDYLKGEVDSNGIKPLFIPVDETRDSILKKKAELDEILSRHPRFRAGLLALATTWLQLHRSKEALDVLEKLHAIDDSDPNVEYFLAELYFKRMDYNKAWHYLRSAEALTRKRHHTPIALRDLRRALAAQHPE